MEKGGLAEPSIDGVSDEGNEELLLLLLLFWGVRGAGGDAVVARKEDCIDGALNDFN